MVSPNDDERAADEFAAVAEIRSLRDEVEARRLVGDDLARRWRRWPPTSRKAGSPVECDQGSAPVMGPNQESFVTFSNLARLEPRLADLEAEVRAVMPKDEFFCAAAVWFGYDDVRGGLKGRMSRLVGQYRADPGPAVLSSRESYDVDCDFLSNLLPPCWSCLCVVPASF
jgi:hypothetical protein